MIGQQQYRRSPYPPAGHRGFPRSLADSSQRGGWRCDAERRPRCAGDDGRRLLLWANCSLDKHGSFEDYLIRLASRAGSRGWRVRICVAGVEHAGVANLVEEAGATLGHMQPGWISAAGFAGEVLGFRPRIVHTHFTSLTTLQPMLLDVLSGGRVRTVISDHSSRSLLQADHDESRLAPLRRWRRRVLARSVDLYLPVSRFVAEMLVDAIGAPARKVVPLLNGVDLARFRPGDAAERIRLRRALTGFGDDTCVVAFVGQLTPEKGVRELLRVQAQLVETRRDIAFLWAGDGPLRGEVEAATGPRSVYLGQRDDTPDVLRTADVLVAPSIWLEAFSLALAEAAATGLPAVASCVGGIPEVVDDGVTGLLVAPGDERALAGALSDLAGNTDKRARMGEAARRRAARLFDLDHAVARTLDHYETLIAANRHLAEEPRRWK